MLVTRLVAAIAIASSSAAVAHQPAPAAPSGPPITVTEKKPAKPDKMVCKQVSTGTMIAKRVCMPKSDWARVEANVDESMRAMSSWQRQRCQFGSRC